MSLERFEKVCRLALIAAAAAALVMVLVMGVCSGRFSRGEQTAATGLHAFEAAEPVTFRVPGSLKGTHGEQ